MKLIKYFAIFLLFPSIAFAGYVNLAWDQGDAVTTGYKIYFGTAPNTLDSVVDVGNVLSYRIDNLTPGTMYYFRATAYDSNGNESVFSAGVYAEPIFEPPIGLHVGD